jgi:hypothetical protein
MLHLPSSICGLYQRAVRCTAGGAQEGDQTGFATKRRDLCHALHTLATLITASLIE